MTQFSPYAGSSAFLNMIPQGVDMRQRAISLQQQQQAEAMRAQQWQQENQLRQQAFQANEAQRAAANQQWQAEQQRLQQNAAMQGQQWQQRFGLDQERFGYQQQQDQRALQQDQATRGANAAYLGNMGLQQPGMQGPPMPVDMGAMSPGMQAFAAGQTAKQQAIEQVRAEQAARTRARFNYYNSNGSWMAAPPETIQDLIDEGYGEFIPKDVLARKGIPDPEAMAQMQAAFNSGDMGGFIGPMAQAGADVSPSFMLQTAKAMQPESQQFKTGSRVVKTPDGTAFTLPTGGGAPLLWDDGDPAVHAIKQAAAAWESPRLDRSWWNPKPDEEEAAYEQRVNIRARDIAAGLGWRVQAPGAAPVAPGSSVPPAGAGVRPPNPYDPTVTGAEAAQGAGDIQSQIRAWAAQGMTRDQIKKKLREMGVGN